MSDITVKFFEEERLGIVTALAALSLNRPGWDRFLRRINEKLDPGCATYNALKTTMEKQSVKKIADVPE